MFRQECNYKGQERRAAKKRCFVYGRRVVGSRHRLHIVHTTVLFQSVNPVGQCTIPVGQCASLNLGGKLWKCGQFDSTNIKYLKARNSIILAETNRFRIFLLRNSTNLATMRQIVFTSCSITHIPAPCWASGFSTTCWGGGVWTPPRLSRLLRIVEQNGKRRSKAREKSFRNHFGHFLAQVKIDVTRGQKSKIF